MAENKINKPEPTIVPVELDMKKAHKQVKSLVKDLNKIQKRLNEIGIKISPVINLNGCAINVAEGAAAQSRYIYGDDVLYHGD